MSYVGPYSSGYFTGPPPLGVVAPQMAPAAQRHDVERVAVVRVVQFHRPAAAVGAAVTHVEQAQLPQTPRRPADEVAFGIAAWVPLPALPHPLGRPALPPSDSRSLWPCLALWRAWTARLRGPTAWGMMGFVARLERVLGRVPRPHKRVPKGPWKHKGRRARTAYWAKRSSSAREYGTTVRDHRRSGMQMKSVCFCAAMVFVAGGAFCAPPGAKHNRKVALLPTEQLPGEAVWVMPARQPVGKGARIIRVVVWFEDQLP